jgi:hypothetical protein
MAIDKNDNIYFTDSATRSRIRSALTSLPTVSI